MPSSWVIFQWLSLQTVHCVVRLLDRSEKFAVLVEPVRLKSPLASEQETERRLNQVAERSRLLWVGALTWRYCARLTDLVSMVRSAHDLQVGVFGLTFDYHRLNSARFGPAEVGRKTTRFLRKLPAPRPTWQTCGERGRWMLLPD